MFLENIFVAESLRRRRIGSLLMTSLGKVSPDHLGKPRKAVLHNSSLAVLRGHRPVSRHVPPRSVATRRLLPTLPRRRLERHETVARTPTHDVTSTNTNTCRECMF